MDNIKNKTPKKTTGNNRKLLSLLSHHSSASSIFTMALMYVLIGCFALFDNTKSIQAATDIANSSLATGLVSYWEMEETSGTRVDSHGSNDLTDNNTVLYAAGIQGNASDHEASLTEYLSIADAAQTGLDITGDITIVAWINRESDGSYALIGKSNFGQGASGRAYAILLDTVGGTAHLDVNISNGSSDVWKSTAATLNTGTWYHIGMVYTASAGSVQFYVNGAAQGSALTGLPTSIGNDANPLVIGGAFDGASMSYKFDGLIDEVGIWSRTLSSTEIGELYNSGSGIPYDAGTPAAATATSTTPFVIRGGSVRIEGGTLRNSQL